MYHDSLIKKWFINCVFPGVEEVLASLECPVSIFINDDLPTLLLPIKAISGNLSGGHWLNFAELISNFALRISIFSFKPLSYSYNAYAYPHKYPLSSPKFLFLPRPKNVYSHWYRKISLLRTNSYKH